MFKRWYCPFRPCRQFSFIWSTRSSQRAEKVFTPLMTSNPPTKKQKLVLLVRIYQFKKNNIVNIFWILIFFQLFQPYFQITQHMSTLQQLCRAPTETALEFSLVSVNTELIKKLNFLILLLLKLTWLQSHFFLRFAFIIPRKLGENKISKYYFVKYSLTFIVLIGTQRDASIVTLHWK